MEKIFPIARLAAASLAACWIVMTIWRSCLHLLGDPLIATIVIGVGAATALSLLSPFVGGPRRDHRRPNGRGNEGPLRAARDLHLNDLEWQAIRIALSDASNRLGIDTHDGSLAAFLNRFSGAQTPRPLADPRLEALRRFTCHVRRHNRIDAHLAEGLERHGFNSRQVEALAALAA